MIRVHFCTLTVISHKTIALQNSFIRNVLGVFNIPFVSKSVSEEVYLFRRVVVLLLIETGHI